MFSHKDDNYIDKQSSIQNKKIEKIMVFVTKKSRKGLNGQKIS